MILPVPSDSARATSQAEQKPSDPSLSGCLDRLMQTFGQTAFMYLPDQSHRPAVTTAQLENTWQSSLDQLTPFQSRYFFDEAGRMLDVHQIVSAAESKQSERISHPTAKKPESNFIYWPKSVFVPHTSYFILFGNKSSFVRSVADINRDVAVLAELSIFDTVETRPCKFLANSGTEADLLRHRVSYLIVYGEVSLKVVDLRRLYTSEELPVEVEHSAPKLPVFCVKYPDGVKLKDPVFLDSTTFVFRGSTGDSCFKVVGEWPGFGEPHKDFNSAQLRFERKDLPKPGSLPPKLPLFHTTDNHHRCIASYQSTIYSIDVSSDMTVASKAPVRSPSLKNTR